MRLSDREKVRFVSKRANRGEKHTVDEQPRYTPPVSPPSPQTPLLPSFPPLVPQRRRPDAVSVVATTLTLSIPVLGSIFWFLIRPILNQPKDKAQTAACLSNMKSLGAAQMLYAQDYDEKLPPAALWMDATFTYIKNWQTYRCPSVESSNAPSRPTEDLSSYGYAYNSDLSHVGLSRIKNIETAILVFESDKLIRNATDPLFSVPFPARHLAHRVNHVVFTDGHAKSKETDLSEGRPILESNR